MTGHFPHTDTTTFDRRRIMPAAAIAMAVLLAAAPAVQAQNAVKALTDTLRYTLEDAVMTALERNPTVTIQRLSHDISDTYRRQQLAGFDPSLSAGMSNTDSKSQRFLGAKREPYELETKRFQYHIGLDEDLPTGTNVSVDVAMSGYKSNIYTDQYTGSMGITVTQSLLKGFGFGSNLAGLRRANLDVDISRAELKGVAERVVGDVEAAYWNLYLAAEEIAIQERSMALAEQQLSESVERVAVGKLPELELAAVHAEVASRRESLIQSLGNYEQARLQLLFLLNPKSQISWDIPVLTAERPSIPSDSLDLVDDHVALGLKFRPDLNQAQFQLKKGEIGVVQTRNGLLPQLDVFITMGKTSYAESFNEGRPDIGSKFYDVMTGFTFSIPIFDRSERACNARAKYTVAQQKEAVHNMERMVERDIRSAYIDVSRSRQLIDASRVSRELQEKKLAAEQEKFRVGKSTNFLVLQAQRDYILSQLAEARSLVSYLNSLTDLYLMEGTLLERRHIDPGID